MAVSGVDLDINLKIGTDQLNQLNDQIQTSLNRGLAGAASTAAGGLGKVDTGLKKIEDSSERAAEAAEGLLEKLSVSDAIGAFGDLKDVFEQTTKNLFGLSEQAVETVVHIGDIAEKGANIGAPFGPAGAAAGAAIGLVVGGLSAWAEASDRARQASLQLAFAGIAATTAAAEKSALQWRESLNSLEEYNNAVRASGGATLSILSASVEAIQEESKAARDAHDTRRREWEDAIKRQKSIMEGRTASAAEIKNLAEYETGLERVRAEFGQQERDRLQNLSVQVLPDLANAFAESEKETEAFREAYANIGKEKTVESLTQEVKDAEAALVDAEAATVRAREELAKPFRFGEGNQESILDYLTRLKVALIDSEVAAKNLSEAQSVAFGAKTSEAGAIERSTEDRKRKAADAQRAKVDAINAETERLLARVEDKAETTLDTAGLATLRDDLPELQSRLVQNYIEMENVADILSRIEVQAIDTGEAFSLFGEQLKNTKTLFEEIGVAAAEYLAGRATNALNSFYDSWANKEKLTQEQRKRRRAEFLRDTGDFLVTDGTKHIFAGGADLAAGDITGGTEIAAGIVEVGAGVAMGGVGAIAQRRLGGTADNAGARGTGADGGPSVSALDNAANGPQDRGTVTININNAVPQTARGAQEQALMLAGMLGKRPRRGPAS